VQSGVALDEERLRGLVVARPERLAIYDEIRRRMTEG
jgi:hypothetical protein